MRVPQGQEKRGMLHVFDEATKKWKLRHVLLSEYTLQYFRRVQKVHAGIGARQSLAWMAR